MRTKAEIAKILAGRKAPQMLAESTWSDLVGVVGQASPEQRAQLVRYLAEGKTSQVGEILYKGLSTDAESRALAYVNSVLADDAMSLEELDEFL